MKRIKKLIITIMTIMFILGQTNGYSASSGKDHGINFSAPGGAPDNKSPLPGSVSWTEVQPAGDVDKYWTCSAISSDGLTMISGSAWDGGRLYLSSNGGGSWSEVQPAGDVDKIWACVAISGDASTIVAGAEEGRLYRSTDGGATWNETQPDGDDDWIWESVSVSNNGFTMLASYGGPLFISIDQGVSWNQTGYAGFEQYSKVSVALNGDYLLATAEKEYIFYSNDGGTNWDFVDVTGGYNWEWASAAISADGSTMLAATVENSMQGTSGRLFMSIDYGVTWAETQPYGDNDLEWTSVSLSGNGSVMLAGITDGTPFLSTDKGLTWSIMWPAGENNFYEWQTVSVSSDGTTLLAGIYEGRMYKGTITGPPEVEFYGAPVFTSITVNCSSAIGKIVSTNGANASHRGGIVYEYTDTDKIIGDAGVTQVDSTGTYGTCEFPVSFTGLLANTRYNARVYATNSNGTGYSDREDFWTLANVPEAPVLSNNSATSLYLVLNSNSNPASTEFAIQDSVAGTFVQANGTRAATAVWQTTENWDTVTITGLTTGSTYYFRVKAKNGDGVETTFGISASGISMTVPTIKYPISGGHWEETMPAGNVDKNWISVRYSSDGSTILAGVYGGRLYKSTNEGVSWQETRPAGNTNKWWYTVSVSADGSIMLAGAESGRLYKSTDAGNTWSEIQPAGNNNFDWQSVSVSGDGTRILAGITLGRLYFSSNGGTSWNELQLAGNTNIGWPTVSISNDGNSMLAGANNYRLYKSTNGGASWSETQPAGNTNKYWLTTSISNNGSLMLAGVYNGRMYKSTDAGTSWSETQPAGNANKSWISSSVSTDGSHLLAGSSIGRLYKSTDGGSSWSETQPAGNYDKRWVTSSITSDGSNMMAGVFGGRLYRWVNEYQNVTDIAATFATGNGKINNLNGGGNATNQGIIHYPYTNTDKIIGDAEVTNVSKNGSFGIGEFTESLNGLAVNSRYNMRAHATNNAGTGYSDRSDFWTLASVPGALVIDSLGATTVYMTPDTSNNPAITEYAIRAQFEEAVKTPVTTKYVNATTGALQDSADWQSGTTWGNIEVTGLETGLQYIFTAKARNGSNVETDFSDTASAVPASKPVVCAFGNSFWKETQPAGNSNKNWQTVSVSADGMTMLAGDFIGRLYLSKDKGNNWSEIQPAGDNDLLWVKVSVSGDGSTLLAGIQGGRLYLSTDGGITWSETQPAGNKNADWFSLASSTDGSTIMAGISATRLYFSSNRGSSWTEVQPGGDYDYDWRSVAVSGNGNKILAAAKNKRLYLSTDHCISWNEVQPAGDVDKKWQTVSISTDGNVLIAGANTGRLYLSTDGGASWSEQQPAGDADKKWHAVSVSSDGAKMLAAVLQGRLYESVDTGATWNEIQPAGNADKQWTSVAVSANSHISLAGIIFERMFVFDFLGVDNITVNSSSGQGNIHSTEGASITNRGFICYPYTGSNKEIGDAGVISTDENGTFGTGNFTLDLIDLSANAHYNIRSHSTNYKGIGYSDRKDFWTLASVPAALVIDSLGATTVYMTPDTSNNPAITEYAVRAQFEPNLKGSLTEKYVNAATGALQDTEDWQTNTSWGNIAATGLETGLQYIFTVKARNGANVETAFSDTASAIPTAKPAMSWKVVETVWDSTDTGKHWWMDLDVSADGRSMVACYFSGRVFKTSDRGSTWTETRPAGDADKMWRKVVMSNDGQIMLAAENYSPLYKSDDNGTTWTEAQPAGNQPQNWKALSISGDGSTLIAGAANERIYLSKDSGDTWNEVQPGGDFDLNWYSAGISDDGRIMIASVKNGRMYVSADGGTSWEETQPLGDNDQNWYSAAVSGDGQTLLASIQYGRMYKSDDLGITWYEIRPLDDNDYPWIKISTSYDGQVVYVCEEDNNLLFESLDGGDTWTEILNGRHWTGASVSTDGTTALAAGMDEKLFTGDLVIFDSITATTASATANMLSTCGADAFNRGAIYYNYDNTNKEIGDAGVINFDSTGVFLAGEYPVSFTGLAVNTHYNARAHATNYKGTGYSPGDDFWTLANVPGAPTLDSVTANSIDVTLDLNGNPSYTEFAIKVTWDDGSKSMVTKYVNSSTGNLQATEDWQTDSVWGTKTIGNLLTGQEYIVAVKARNGDQVETAFGDSASAMTCSNPTNAGVIGSHQIIEFLTLPQLLTSSSGATDYGGTLEYKWQSSSESDSTGFADIANTNHDTYQPEALSDTTWFRRVARVDCRPDWNDAVFSNVVKVTVVFRQHILIPQGWSYISSYLDPHNSDVISMFESIVGANHLSILTGIQGIYAPPPLYINTFGNWDVLKGYKVSMRQQDELVITGDTLLNKTVDFDAGVHIIPVLTNQNTDITDVFSNPASDILYMLDIYSNLVYWPSGSIFTLSELIPGRGYLANFKNPVTLSYPPLSVARKATAIQPHPADGPWACNRSSNVHLISVSSDALKDLNGADFIGTFDHFGNCTGYAPIRITGQNQLLTVYGDDPFTSDIDGMAENETLRFKTYRCDENSEQEFTAIFNNIFPNADGLYYSNGLSGIAKFKESATGIGEGNTNYAILVFPNPARDELNITIPQTPSGFSFPDSGIKAVLVSGDGKTVKSLDLVSTQNKIDVSTINPGIYLLRIYFDENLIVKRIVIH